MASYSGDMHPALPFSRFPPFQPPPHYELPTMKDTAADDFIVTDVVAQRKQLNLKYEKRRQFGKLSQNKAFIESRKNKYNDTALTKFLIQVKEEKLASQNTIPALA